MKRDDGPVPQFTSRRARRWTSRKRSSSGGSSWADQLGSSIDLGEFIVLIVRVLGRAIVAIFEHHHW